MQITYQVSVFRQDHNWNSLFVLRVDLFQVPKRDRLITQDWNQNFLALSVGVVEYTDCTSEEC